MVKENAEPGGGLQRTLSVVSDTHYDYSLKIIHKENGYHGFEILIYTIPKNVYRWNWFYGEGIPQVLADYLLKHYAHVNVQQIEPNLLVLFH